MGLKRLIPRLTRSVMQECTLNDGGKYKDVYKYIVEEPAKEKLTGEFDLLNRPIIFDKGHEGVLAAARSAPGRRRARARLAAHRARARRTLMSSFRLPRAWRSSRRSRGRAEAAQLLSHARGARGGADDGRGGRAAHVHDGLLQAVERHAAQRRRGAHRQVGDVHLGAPPCHPPLPSPHHPPVHASR